MRKQSKKTSAPPCDRNLWPNVIRICTINLHISLLPWNKGADPNLWSFLEDTPKGVTIHLIDKKIDKGSILLQREVNMDIEHETLRSSFQKLLDAIEELFMENWEPFKAGRLKPFAQIGNGSCHRTPDKEKYRHLLQLGWDTPVKNLIGHAKEKSICCRLSTMIRAS